MHTIDPSDYFTLDLGYGSSGGGGTFLAGPLVLTYLDPAGAVEVRQGHPANADEDSPLIERLSGASFRGSFFVGPGWTISGTTPSTLVSGYYLCPHLSRLENKAHPLSDRGEFIYRPLKESEILIPSGGDLYTRKIAAIREVETLLGWSIVLLGDWEEDDRRLRLYFELNPLNARIQARIEHLRKSAGTTT